MLTNFTDFSDFHGEGLNGVLKTKRDKAFWWVKYIEGIFLIWTIGHKK